MMNEPITKGRKVVEVKFIIEQKKPIERAIADITTSNKLEKRSKNEEKRENDNI